MLPRLSIQGSVAARGATPSAFQGLLAVQNPLALGLSKDEREPGSVVQMHAASSFDKLRMSESPQDEREHRCGGSDARRLIFDNSQDERTSQDERISTSPG
jgi:hypothetical protein